MRKLLFTIGLSMLIIGLSFGQWSGTSLDGDTYRNGNVGLGISNPSSYFHLSKWLDNSNNFHWITFDNKGNGWMDWSIMKTGNYDISFCHEIDGNNVTPVMTFKHDGNIGIGTTEPEAFLHMSKWLDNPNDYNWITFDNKGNGWADWSITKTNSFDLSICYGIDGSGVTPSITFKHGGNVGIGCTAPDHKLDVEGTIRAQEVKVNLDGCDFVFEDDYKLKSLNEVEGFIKANKRLPEIESAAEMEADGTNLGELNSKLLQKIEELTLYTIDQEKRIDELEKQNTEVERLKKIIERNGLK